jgi:hypothetical protein
MAVLALLLLLVGTLDLVLLVVLALLLALLLVLFSSTFGTGTGTGPLEVALVAFGIPLRVLETVSLLLRLNTLKSSSLLSVPCDIDKECLFSLFLGLDKSISSILLLNVLGLGLKGEIVTWLFARVSSSSSFFVVVVVVAAPVAAFLVGLGLFGLGDFGSPSPFDVSI